MNCNKCYIYSDCYTVRRFSNDHIIAEKVSTQTPQSFQVGDRQQQGSFSNKMISPSSFQGLLTALLTSNMVQSSNTRSEIPMEAIRFVLTNHGGLSFALPPSTPTTHLRATISELCDLTLPFEVQLFGKTIVSPQMSMNQTIAEIPNIMSIANDLNQIWGDGFRIPLTVHSRGEDVAIYHSLTQIFGGLGSNVHDFEWYQFILQCTRSESCTMQDLCDRFHTQFYCGDGKLIYIKLHYRITGILDLNHVPDTITTLILDHNWFSEIIGLDRLMGKQLRLLDVRGSPLNFDLRPLVKSSSRSIGNPLRFVRVSPNQISWHLLGIRQEIYPETRAIYMEIRRAAAQWFYSSILTSMTLGRRNRLRK